MQIKRRFIFLLFTLSAIYACENHAGEESARNQPATKAEAVNQGDAPSHKIYELVNDRKAEFFADFDSDGKQDHLQLVNSDSLPPSIVNDFNVIYAWPNNGEGERPALAESGPISLLITTAYKTDKQDNFLIVDPNPISILATDAAKEMFVAKRNNPDSSAWKEIGNNAVGDILVIPTETGIDSYLYWDGKRFTSLEVLEVP